MTKNEELAKRCCTPGPNGTVLTPTDIISQEQGAYQCNNVSKRGMPVRAQAPSTVSPFGSLK